MNIREALRCMTPSLELMRAAADEIARLDAQLAGRPPAPAPAPKPQHTDLDDGFECDETQHTINRLLANGPM